MSAVAPRGRGPKHSDTHESGCPYGSRTLLPVTLSTTVLFSMKACACGRVSPQYSHRQLDIRAGRKVSDVVLLTYRADEMVALFRGEELMESAKPERLINARKDARQQGEVALAGEGTHNMALGSHDRYSTHVPVPGVLLFLRACQRSDCFVTTATRMQQCLRSVRKIVTHSSVGGF